MPEQGENVSSRPLDTRPFQKRQSLFPDGDELVESRAFDSPGKLWSKPKLELWATFLEFALEGASRCRCLVDHDLTEAREVFFKLPPKPSRHDLNRGTL